MHITDLPEDILFSIFPYLNASEFLRLTSSTKALYPYRDEISFWHPLTRKTFRIPAQPLLQGARGQWLYRGLLTQTRLYTWGDNKSNNLGHREYDDLYALHTPRRRQVHHHSAWPKRAVMRQDVGAVADIQCGGWSTTMLNSIGAIYIFGILDRRRRSDSGLRKLGFPPAYPPTTTDRYEPSTAIKQFSTGRSSLLGLSDDGKVWSWTQDTAILIKSVHVDLMENRVTRVEAGWDRSSMYVKGTGIVYWAPDQDSDLLQGGRQEALAVADAVLIDTVTIPGTGYRRSRNERDLGDSLDARIGEVTCYIVLEAHIVFVTHLNKIFSYPTTFPMPALNIPEPVELTTFYNLSPSPFEIRDLQGAFSNFALFMKSGSIFTAQRPLLDAFHRVFDQDFSSNSEPLPQPTLIPSLQNKSIISLAFGDHHFLALHSNGTIKSYGRELCKCGSLGLGDKGQEMLRGVRRAPVHFDSNLLPPNEARTVWFEPLMQRWIDDIKKKGKSEESKERFDLLGHRDHDTCRAIGDYFEREGTKWEHGIGSSENEDEIGSYFAIKIAAAGWHSAALVLVDEARAERARRAHIVPPKRALTPTPAPSEAGSLDSYYVIESPGEQLTAAVYSICEFLWWLGRWFLGLTDRDAASRAEKSQGGREKVARDEADEDDVYTWRDDPFPRLRLGDGRAMPGSIEVME